LIPAILHQTWKSKTDLPAPFRHWRASFLQLNPGFQFPLYDDADNRALLAQVFPQLLPLYDSLPREIFRADFIRPVYLYRFGGFYADLDFQCLAPLASLAGRHDIVLGRMGSDESFAHSIPNALMASTPGQAFWIGYLAHCVAQWEALKSRPNMEARPEFVTGPVVLRAAALRYTQQRELFSRIVHGFITTCALDIDPDALGYGELTLLPAPVMYPLNWKDEAHRQFMDATVRRNILHGVPEAQRLFPGSIAVTWWAHSWGE
jgi:inositol phosphorylceramide mannosyltransferase catalytic subunit